MGLKVILDFYCQEGILTVTKNKIDFNKNISAVVPVGDAATGDDGKEYRGLLPVTESRRG